ncbi:MAG: hypothetical protein A4E28_02179 [Methanocella sp. PtaU1.Bin125]|nr:MAG: hypothetical protein A4E28_02179 [Methanocella sp. PtaU1.Bin125]
MHLKTTIFVFATLAVAVSLAAAAMPATSQGTASMDGMSTGDLSGLAAMAMPKAVMLTVEAGNMTDGNLTYTIPYAARVQQLGDRDIAIVATYDRPLTKTVNVPAGTGIISIDEALPATAKIDYTNRSSIPVAGANAVVVLRQFELTGVAMEKGDISLQVGSITAYLPDGTAKAMKLDRPVKMTMSLDQMKLRVDAGPELARAMADMLTTGPGFPADAKPVALSDILAAK